MYLDALLSIGHHLSVYALLTCMVSEWILLSSPVDAPALRRIARVDLAFGIVAACLLVIGTLRVVWGAKGAAFYTHNPVFWLKVSLFCVVGILSVVPTVRIIRWQRRYRSHPATLPSTPELLATRRWLVWEFAVALAIPVCAALMARGVGY